MDESMAAMEWSRSWGLNLSGAGLARPAPREAELPLIQGAARGDRGAVCTLVERYQDTLFAMAMSFARDPHRAEDLAQEAWIRILEGLPGYRGQARFSSWMYRVTLNTYLNSRRSDASRERREQVYEPPAPAPERDAALDLQRAVRALPVEFRAVVALRFAADLSYKEIAEVLDIPLGTVQSRLNRALDRLAKEVSR